MAAINKHTSKDGAVTYRVRVRLKGFPVQTATFKRKTDAEKWATNTESAILENRYFRTTEARKHTLADMIDRYLNDVLPTKPKLIKDQTHQFIWFKEAIGRYLLVDVTPAVIGQCRDRLLNEVGPKNKKRSNATVVRYLSALSAAFTECVNDWQWLDESPMSKVRKPVEPKGRIRFLSEDDELPRFLKACKESSNAWLYLCMILSLSTGMRQGELMNLTWPNVNLKEGYIILYETKNGESRRVPLAGQALEFLREHAKVRRLDSELLFPSHDDPSKPIDLRRPFKNSLTAAGISNFKWHDLRHCAASYLSMNGATLNDIAVVLGHKTLSMVKRYAHLSDSHVTSVVSSMNSRILGDK